MELPLQPMEQLGYLFFNDKVHENSEPDEIVEEVVDMHDMYVNSDAFWDAYEYETERKVFRAKEKRAEERGKNAGIEEGILKGKRETIIKFLNKKLNLLPERLIKEINAANNEQLDELSDCIFDINSEEDVLSLINHVSIDKSKTK